MHFNAIACLIIRQILGSKLEKCRNKFWQIISKLTKNSFISFAIISKLNMEVNKLQVLKYFLYDVLS